MNPSILLLFLVLFPFAASAVTFAVGKLAERRGKKTAQTVRCALLIAVCTAELFLAVYLLLSGNGATCSIAPCRIHLSFDGLRAIYAVITAFMWTGAALLSPQYFKHHGISGRYCFFFLFTLGATLGVFLSTDLITTFIFFELMSLASYAWVVEEETVGAIKAGKTYLTIAVLGGMVTLMGLFLLYHLTGTLDIATLRSICPTVENRTELYAAAICILFGFGAKAGIFPVHIWLPKAHPVAPAPASALLSGVLTKAGVFGILVVTANLLPADHLWGNLLLTLGAVTMFLGALLAVFSVNLKRTLACSSLSQIGFITVGVSMICLLGEHNSLAANGTILYMMNHSLVKLVLFLTAGAIYAMAHTLDLNELRGFGRKKPLLGAVFLVGGCSLAGIPGTLGYLSKTLVHESIVEYAEHGGAVIFFVEWLFLLSGGLTAAYVTKLFVAIFLEKPNAQAVHQSAYHQKPRITVLSWTALIVGAIPILLLGCTPHLFAEKLSAFGLSFVGGHEISHEVHYLAWQNLKGVCISLAVAAIVYPLIVRGLLMKKDSKLGKRIYANRWAAKFAIEDLVYIPIGKLLLGVLTGIARFLAALPDKLVILFVKLSRIVCRYACDLPDILVSLFEQFLCIVCRSACDLPDLAVLGARKTVLRPVDPPSEDRSEHPICHAVGSFIDRSVRKKNPNVDTADTLIRAFETVKAITGKIVGNFSFALLMVCFGIVVILIWLIFSK